MKTSAHVMRAGRGFTLVELLVVIVIISILVGLVTGAAIQVRRTARQTVIRTEIEQFQLALEAYKTEYGEYPPDFSGLQDPREPIRLEAQHAVVRHLRKAFPRYPLPPDDPSTTGVDEGFVAFASQLASAYGIDASQLDPAAALVFWLGGLPDRVSGSMTPAGFHADPANPFQGGVPRKKPLFEFNKERYVAVESSPLNGTRYMRYYPAGVTLSGNQGAAPVPAAEDRSPYVYFKARKLAVCGGRYEYAYSNSTDPRNATVFPAFYSHGPNNVTENVCVPYLGEYPGPAPYFLSDAGKPAPNVTDVSNTGLASPDHIRRWRNLETFQIIAPGVDGRYGNLDPQNNDPSQLDRYRFRFTKTGHNFGPDRHDFDNLTNFTSGTLEDEFE